MTLGILRQKTDILISKLDKCLQGHSGSTGVNIMTLNQKDISIHMRGRVSGRECVKWTRSGHLLVEVKRSHSFLESNDKSLDSDKIQFAISVLGFYLDFDLRLRLTIFFTCEHLASASVNTSWDASADQVFIRFKNIEQMNQMNVDSLIFRTLICGYATELTGFASRVQYYLVQKVICKVNQKRNERGFSLLNGASIIITNLRVIFSTKLFSFFFQTSPD